MKGTWNKELKISKSDDVKLLDGVLVYFLVIGRCDKSLQEHPLQIEVFIL